jgi:hypothetical protein
VNSELAVKAATPLAAPLDRLRDGVRHLRGRAT